MSDAVTIPDTSSAGGVGDSFGEPQTRTIDVEVTLVTDEQPGRDA